PVGCPRRRPAGDVLESRPRFYAAVSGYKPRWRGGAGFVYAERTAARAGFDRCTGNCARRHGRLLRLLQPLSTCRGVGWRCGEARMAAGDRVRARSAEGKAATLA